MSFCWKINCAASGDSRGTWCRIAARCATSSIGHHYKPTQAEASAISLKRGMDNECIDFDALKVKDDHDYKPYLDAVREGYLKESDIDRGADRAVYGADEAGDVRPSGDGALLEDRCERAGQRGAPRSGAASWRMSRWSS